jgi:hypothetical protein
VSNATRRGMLLVSFALLLASLGATAADAAPPTQATGTVANTSANFDSVRVAGSNLIIELSATATYTGTFTGTSTIHGILIVHADGSANFHDVETFTGSVNGVPGTVTLRLNGSNDASLAVHATRTIIGATGELAGLHGVLHEIGTVVLPNGPSSTYEGQIGLN